jgi:hypothetical protein
MGSELSMFERQLVLEKRQGYRGPATRFVAPISDVVEADRVIRECSFAILALGAFQIFLTFTMGGGSVTIGIVLIAAATLLFVTRGVLSAAVLLTVCFVLLLMQAWAIAVGYRAIVWIALLRCIVSTRALYAALTRRRLSHLASPNERTGGV